MTTKLRWRASRGLKKLTLLERRCDIRAFSIFLALCLVFCCERGEAVPALTSPSRQITIINDGPARVVAEVSSVLDAEGAVSVKVISIESQENTFIKAVKGALYYDNDSSGSLDSSSDGVVMRIEDSLSSPSTSFTISAGVVHAGPGIGSLRMECDLELIREDGQECLVPLTMDLSPVFQDLSNP